MIKNFPFFAFLAVTNNKYDINIKAILIILNIYLY